MLKPQTPILDQGRSHENSGEWRLDIAQPQGEATAVQSRPAFAPFDRCRPTALAPMTGRHVMQTPDLQDHGLFATRFSAKRKISVREPGPPSWKSDARLHTLILTGSTTSRCVSGQQP